MSQFGINYLRGENFILLLLFNWSTLKIWLFSQHNFRNVFCVFFKLWQKTIKTCRINWVHKFFFIFLNYLKCSKVSTHLFTISNFTWLFILRNLSIFIRFLLIFDVPNSWPTHSLQHLLFSIELSLSFFY